MTKLLDTFDAQSTALMLVGLIDEIGYSTEEAIPGLVQAIVNLAKVHPQTEQLLDEAANLLADGGLDRAD